MRLRNEIECWNGIDPLGKVLIAVEPDLPPIAGLELAVMVDTIGKLVGDEIAPADADLVVLGLAALRSALLLSGDRTALLAT